MTAARYGRTAGVRQALEIASALRQANAPAYEAVALHDAVRLGAAAEVATRLGELSQDSTSVLLRSFAAHALALARHDHAGLERVSVELETIDALLLAAETAAEASHAYRLAGRSDSARRTAARAAALMTKCEGGATPALQSLQSPSLTPRQREIVTLAARGLSNEEIANRLVVSVRTVHNHLHQAYTKLGVHSRAELGGVLASARSGSEHLGRPQVWT